MVSAIKIHSKDVDLRFLICGEPCDLDAFLLAPLEDGLSAILNIEIRGSNLRNRVSALPPILEAGTVPNGEATVKCEFTTTNYAFFSVVVSGGATITFDDQLLESHIKKELIGKHYPLVTGISNCGPYEQPKSWTSLCVAAGAPCFEVSMKVPAWASEVMKYLASEFSNRSLAILGVGCIAGVPVASFEKEDADRFLFFCKKRGKQQSIHDSITFRPPFWHAALIHDDNETGDSSSSDKTIKKRFNIAALRPIPRPRHLKKPPFFGNRNIIPESYAQDGDKNKVDMMIVPAPTDCFIPLPASRQMDPTGPTLSPLEKHGCERSSIMVCSEEEFMQDLFQFTMHRGRNWLIPKGGLSEFPDVIINGSRLDLFNLYREVVSRGGFIVSKGINWRGQVFFNMTNYTDSHKMTSIGSILKRHYGTYLWEYELAHDDAETGCCQLCNSGGPGNWVSCSACGGWAHYNCDTRRSLASFKDYAKADGLEYICPPCSLSKRKNKSHETSNRFP